ncbi:SusC/RagA family TonB-linked outer membrane protein [Parafilimonas sp.]|uniref:SusC/RagA family TonB-linked outer membrane protein n=1 Tax=Parafilimonas sp. TaxID=1969739 RepID=UPI0039E48798
MNFFYFKPLLRFTLFAAVVLMVSIPTMPCSAQQQRIINGQVTDAATNQPVPNASINIKGSGKGALSDIHGNFNLHVKGEDSLVVSSVGYETQTVFVGSQDFIRLQLKPGNNQLDQVIVVGYGTQRKKDVTGAVQTVDMNKLQDIPVSQFTQKLQGKLAGVQINQNTGQPGKGMSVRIRGQLSVSAGSDPLYVVDGFPIVGNIGSINPDEIESISILKDAASTSLYGSRAANGVVLITTKQAKGGQTTVGINAYVGTQAVPEHGRIKMMNAEEFAEFKKEYYEDEGADVPEIFQDPSIYKGKNNDWYGAMLQKAPLESFNLTIASRNDKMSTAIVAGVLGQQGVVIQTKYTRYSLRMNMDYNLSPKVKVGFGLAPSYIYDNQPQTDGDRGTGLLFDALHTWPIMPIYDSTGKLTEYNQLDASTGNIYAYPNWVRAAREITDETKYVNMISNAYVQYEPIRGLVLKSSMNVQYINTKYFFFNPSTATYAINVSIPTTAVSKRSNQDEVTWLNENLATYTKSFGNHNFELLAGFTNQKYRQEATVVQADTYTDDRINTIQSAVNISRSGTYNTANEWTLTSYLSRLTYNFKNKYLFTAALRSDGSSRFGADNRWGTFPSFSLGWVLSDESFFSRLPKISFAKVRTSYGVIGNNNIGNYTSYALVDNTANAVFNDNVATGAAITSLANSNLGWETTKAYDAGIDLGFFNDRIQFTYDYYLKHTTNLLYSVQVPQESGFSSYYDNIGELKFWGHEFSVTTRNTVGKFQWTTSANISFNRNKVLALADGINRVYGSFNITEVGHPFGVFYGLQKLGHYMNEDDLEKSPVIAGRSTVGSIKLKDVNGDGEITYGGDDDDRTIIGSPFPKFIYGITNTINYRNFDFSVVASGSYGNQLYMRHLYSLANLDGVFNMVERVKYRWRSEENPGDGFFGTTVGGGTVTGVERDWPNSQFVANASFFTIKNITIGYTAGIKSKAIKSARVYASCQQVYVFSKYWGGANPETSYSSDNLSQGLDLSNYPVPRTYTLGVNLNF